MPLGFLFGGGKPPKRTQAQKDVARMQRDAMQAAMPYYAPALQFLGQRAGINTGQASTMPVAGTAQNQAGFGVRGGPQQQLAASLAGGSPVSPRTGQPIPPGGTGIFANRISEAEWSAMSPEEKSAWAGRTQGANQALASFAGGQGQPGVLGYDRIGIYGSNPEERYRLQQGENLINRQAGLHERMLAMRLGQQGLGGSGTMASALAQNRMNALRGLSDFHRNMAINAGTEQERRTQNLLAAMGIGTAAGQQVAQSGLAQQQMAQSAQQNQMQNLLALAGFFI